MGHNVAVLLSLLCLLSGLVHVAYGNCSGVVTLSGEFGSFGHDPLFSQNPCSWEYHGAPNGASQVVLTIQSMNTTGATPVVLYDGIGVGVNSMVLEGLQKSFVTTQPDFKVQWEGTDIQEFVISYNIVEEYSCPQDCSGHGNCVSGVCMCKELYFGWDCSKGGSCEGVQCPVHAVCHQGQCVCEEGFVMLNKTCQEVLPRFCHHGPGDPVQLSGNFGYFSNYLALSSKYATAETPVSDCAWNITGEDTYDASVLVFSFHSLNLWDAQILIYDLTNLVEPVVTLTQAQAPMLNIVVNSRDVLVVLQQTAVQHDVRRMFDASWMRVQSGTCPKHCSGMDGGSCDMGVCISCDLGYYGSECSHGMLCQEYCDHGECIANECVCNQGWEGNACSIVVNCDPACVHGHCELGVCVCDNGWEGPDCSTEVYCDPACVHGHCEVGVCVCDNGWEGPDCSTEVYCDPACVHGHCEVGVCVCDNGWEGPDCSTEDVCDPACTHGYCEHSQCVCEQGWGAEACDDQTAPHMILAQTTTRGKEIEITFDVDTDMGVSRGWDRGVYCSDIFEEHTNKLGSSVCRFSDLRTLSISLQGASMVVGDMLTLIDQNVIHMYHKKTFDYAQGSILLSPSIFVPVPDFGLVAPEIVGVCDGFDIHVVLLSPESVFLGRDPIIEWEIVNENTCHQSIKDRVRSFTGSSLRISSSEMCEGEELEFVVKMSSWASKTRGRNVYITKQDQLIPLVTISEADRDLVTYEELALHAIVETPIDCFTHQAAHVRSPLSFTWEIHPSSMQLVGLDLTGPSLVIPPYTLQAGVVYSFKVHVQGFFADEVYASKNTASVSITTTQAPLVAHIAGGSRRTQTLQHVLELDGSLSRDMNVRSQSPSSFFSIYQYSWDCVLADVNPSTPCMDEQTNQALYLPAFTSQSGSHIFIDGSHLKPGAYEFSLTVRDVATGREASSAVVVDMVSGYSDTLLIKEQKIGVPVVSAQELKLLAQLSAVSSPTPSQIIRWEETENDLLNGLVPFQVVSSPNGDATALILPSNVLSQGKMYTFHASIDASPRLDVNTGPSASLQVFVNESPYGGSCSFSPNNPVVERGTIMSVHCSGWQGRSEGSMPLRYEYILEEERGSFGGLFPYEKIVSVLSMPSEYPALRFRMYGIYALERATVKVNIWDNYGAVTETVASGHFSEASSDFLADGGCIKAMEVAEFLEDVTKEKNLDSVLRVSTQLLNFIRSLNDDVHCVMNEGEIGNDYFIGVALSSILSTVETMAVQELQTQWHVPVVETALAMMDIVPPSVHTRVIDYLQHILESALGSSVQNGYIVPKRVLSILNKIDSTSNNLLYTSVSKTIQQTMAASSKSAICLERIGGWDMPISALAVKECRDISFSSEKPSAYFPSASNSDLAVHLSRTWWRLYWNTLTGATDDRVVVVFSQKPPASSDWLSPTISLALVDTNTLSAVSIPYLDEVFTVDFPHIVELEGKEAECLALLRSNDKEDTWSTDACSLTDTQGCSCMFQGENSMVVGLRTKPPSREVGGEGGKGSNNAAAIAVSVVIAVAAVGGMVVYCRKKRKSSWMSIGEMGERTEEATQIQMYENVDVGGHPVEHTERENPYEDQSAALLP